MVASPLVAKTWLDTQVSPVNKSTANSPNVSAIPQYIRDRPLPTDQISAQELSMWPPWPETLPGTPAW